MNLRWKIAQSAEIRWWQNYLRKKPKADYLAWKKQYWADFLTTIQVQAQTHHRILDAGCGPAGVFTYLTDNQVDALDPLLSQYEIKLEHFDRQQYPQVQFYSQSLEAFQWTQPYDIVFCLNAINHVADLDLCFDKLVACTKKNGTLVVSIDAHNYRFFKTIFRLLPGDILHPHQYDLQEYEQMLRRRGIQIEQTILIKKEFFFDYYTIVGKKI